MSELLNAPEPILQFILKSSQIYYKGKLLVFTKEDLFDKLVKNLPAIWWNDKDRLIYFTYYADGTYYCEREKEVYNYSVREYTVVPYEFTHFSDNDAKQVYNEMCRFFETIRLEQLLLEKESVRKQLMQSFNVIRFDFIAHRNSLLQFSDWTQLPDVVLTMDQDRQNMWNKYRKYLRDITDLDEWKNGEYINVIFPLSPDVVCKKYPELKSDEYLTSENHFDYIVTIAINNKIKNFLNSIRLLTTPQYDEYLVEMMESPSNTTVEEYKKVLKNINEKLMKIDASLKMKINVVIDDSYYVVTEDSTTKITDGIYPDSVEIIDTLIEEISQ